MNRTFQTPVRLGKSGSVTLAKALLPGAGGLATTEALRPESKLQGAWSFQSWLEGAGPPLISHPAGGGGQLEPPRGLWQHFRQCVSCWSISKNPLLPPAQSQQ